MRATSVIITVIAIILHYNCVIAFIFDNIDDSNEKTTNIINYKYSRNCLNNETISNYIKDFQTKYDEIRDVSNDDLFYFQQNDFIEFIDRLCELKRNKARSVTDFIQRIGNECVENEKIRKRFVLNTLLMLEFQLDFICNINESVFTSIYKNQVSICINQNMGLLDKCRENSFKVFFFDKIPAKVTWMQLINGGICNFDYDAMKRCASKPLETCHGGAESLNYLLDIIKMNSLCYKKRNVSDIIESSRDNISSIVN